MRAWQPKLTRKEICVLIIGKTVGDMQRILKQNDFKFQIHKYDDKISEEFKSNKNKTITLEIENNIVTKAS